MSRLLIVACCKRKKQANGELPAIDRYDGPAFRVIRKFLREKNGPSPLIVILSGMHGLIDAAKPIGDYDLRMTRSIADELRPAVLKRIRELIEGGRISTVGLCLGRDYTRAIEGLDGELPDAVVVEVIGGGLGHRLTRLRDWLQETATTKGNSGGGTAASVKPGLVV
jgi:hypothetical protein